VLADWGDGAVNGAYEQCDDGNMANGDGCSSECEIEPPANPCDLNADGDTTDFGECDYNNPCDKNNDGDTTDHGECNHVCHEGE